MKAKLVKNLSANTLQLVINQLSGLVIFYVLSVGLDKNTFGEINLALALMLTSFSILAFGIEQVSVRKIAGGDSPQQVLSLYIIHVLITGCLFYSLLLLGRLFFSSHISYYNIVLLIGIGKTAIHFSMPFKQVAVGMERFGLLARMCVVTNLSRAIGLIVLSLLHLVNLQTVLFVFVGGDVLELLTGIYIFKKETGLPAALQWNGKAYLTLLKESLPQLGVVLITSALARFDWIFIGIFVSALKLAEYSFAYKVFELSGLPLLAIAPVLIPWFTRIFKNGSPNPANLKLLARAEMVVASFTILLVNICWTPFIDPLTHGKYGSVNERTIFLLSLCIPLQYLCNLLWTIYFAKGQLKLILRAFVITLCVNITCDIILIPLYKNEGAAIACLAGFIAQSIYYLSKNEIKVLNTGIYNLLICVGCASISVLTARALFTNNTISIGFAIATFIILLILTMRVRSTDIKSIRSLF
ncbi:oligosaccharide flippase family protein [Mucilaginibacter sp.]|jgi:O-antigen/teichoic acid export membrane protein|uniref:oligosaccharide flippase family protein n=1 Tax=Mucilaginibacter sp. TaxID=1882438 RepID=UPI002B6C53B9|nr:oligosaccharide flippase family protein [Mucilaginibacter sp.]HTI58386.1 oligosaccharide flippase family protein [Mucilaginibacter sp.]